ncbi:MAG: hypothetical protein U0575_08135 [Phycisphaerales bacterium]
MTNASIVKNDATAKTARLNGDPTAGGTKGLFFDDGDSLQLSIDTTSFPAGTKFKQVTFFPTSNQSSSAPGTGTIIFNRSASPQTVTGQRGSGTNVTLFTVSWTTSDLTKPLTIGDVEGVAADDCAWFSVVMTDPSGNDWTLDPELVNTGGASSPGWQPVRAATLARIVSV